MILLTVNTRIMPNSGTKFTPNTNQISNFYNNTQTPPVNLSGMPEKDTFVKQNISFGTYMYTPLVGRPDNELYALELGTALKAKMNEVWDWARENPRYKPYFEKINIEKPRLAIVEGGKPLSKHCSQEVVADYNWINNTIDVNLTHLPNVVLASKGHMSFVPQSTSFKQISRFENGEYGSKKYFEMPEQDLKKAIENSRRYNEKYYYKLDPKDVAELSVPYLVHEMDHLILTHALFNTSGLTKNQDPAKQSGNYLFEPQFEKLKALNRFPDATSRRWTDSYPYNYRAKYPGYSTFSPEDTWEIGKYKDDREYNPKIKFKYLPYRMFDNPKNHMSNCIDLSGQYAALEYIESHTPKIADEKSSNLMTILYDHVRRVIKMDITERERKVIIPDAK